MNEIPTPLFEILFLTGLVLIFYTFRTEKQDEKIMASLFASTISWMNALMIINGNVVEIYANGANYNFIPIQNSSLHYFLQGTAIIMTFATIIIIVKYFQEQIFGGKNE